MRLTFIAKRYPVRTETFVSEPLDWLREAGIDVSMVAGNAGDVGAESAAGLDARILSAASRPTIIATLLGSPLATASVFGRALQLREPGINVRETVWRAMLPEVRAADAVVVHFGSVALRWLVPIVLARKPFAVYFHGYDVGRVLAERPAAYDRLFQSGAGLLTNSEFQRDRLIAAGAPSSKLVVVPLGISPEFAAEALKTRDRTAADDARRVVTIGRLVPKKGIDVSVKAFARMRIDSGRDWEYHVVGDGPLRAEIDTLVASEGLAGTVRLRGFLSRPETIALLRSASIFALASRTAADGDTEGTPVSILEAASLGIPIVATRHAGIPEILPADAPREGFLVEEDDLDAFSSALRRLVASSELRRQWGEACRAHVRQRHSSRAFVTGLLDVVRTIAAAPSVSPQP